VPDDVVRQDIDSVLERYVRREGSIKDSSSPSISIKTSESTSSIAP
jgi:hypothetical protein